MDVTLALQNLITDLPAEEKSAIKKELSAYLNFLLINDFPALVQILYRVDVSESKLKKVLAENKQADAGDLLTELMIERQVQKGLNKSTAPPPGDDPDVESW